MALAETVRHRGPRRNGEASWPSPKR
jgi:hypothetical protein